MQTIKLACAHHLRKSGLGAGSSDGRHGYLPLIVSSTSASACLLLRYPCVQFVAANGRAVGLPSRPPPGGGGAPVLLTRGERARSRLAFVFSGHLPAGSCRPQPILGIRVYLPGDSGASFLRLPWARVQHGARTLCVRMC